MVEKWKQDVLVGINGIASSTPPPTWRLHLPSQQNNNLLHQFLNFPTTTSTISARKLCAKLWQIQHISFAKINNYGTNTLRRRRLQLAQPSDTLSHKPASASSIRRHVVTSLVRRHRSINRNGSALKPISPSCYSSSVQVARYKCAVTPTSSLDVKGMIEESKSRYNITTSTELLSVLNRIWSLEEQLASNISAVETLRMELGRSQT
ncbi:uncharacterized protein At5g41620-like [Cicer arietinum]|uniref:uncharacterized protein At5g41620-like n=1 Tax=Cicer arietinum TaxID=3827 RepID=UPI003CC6A675